MQSLVDETDVIENIVVSLNYPFTNDNPIVVVVDIIHKLLSTSKEVVVNEDYDEEFIGLKWGEENIELIGKLLYYLDNWYGIDFYYINPVTEHMDQIFSLVGGIDLWEEGSHTAFSDADDDLYRIIDLYLEKYNNEDKNKKGI